MTMSVDNPQHAELARWPRCDRCSLAMTLPPTSRSASARWIDSFRRVRSRHTGSAGTVASASRTSNGSSGVGRSRRLETTSQMPGTGLWLARYTTPDGRCSKRVSTSANVMLRRRSLKRYGGRHSLGPLHCSSTSSTSGSNAFPVTRGLSRPTASESAGTSSLTSRARSLPDHRVPEGVTAARPSRATEVWPR